MLVALEVFSDLSERIAYNLPDFPLYVQTGNLRMFHKYAAACHWHADLEFILMLEGAMDYYINGQIVRLEQGNGIFVNSKRMHYGFSADLTDAIYLVVAVHPSLLGEGTHTGKVYLEEKFGINTNDFVLLNSQVAWQQEMLLSMRKMLDEMRNDNRNPLRLLAQATTLCATIGDHLQPLASQSTDDQAWHTIWKMAEYIQQNYDLKLTLDDIAAAGNICRSRCCELFNKHIGQTPNNYLTHYRIQKSGTMLRETNRSISEIAVACGFQSGSYFSYVFHKEMGMVPQDYRKQTVIASN